MSAHPEPVPTDTETETARKARRLLELALRWDASTVDERSLAYRRASAMLEELERHGLAVCAWDPTQEEWYR